MTSIMAIISYNCSVTYKPNYLPMATQIWLLCFCMPSFLC